MTKEQTELWLLRFQQDDNFFWSAEALNQVSTKSSLAKGTQSTSETRLVGAVLEYYLRRRQPISVALQTRCVELLGLLLKQGHSAMGMVGKLPVWLHILRLRFTELYPLLVFPPTPSLAATIQSAGYLGTLVKLALQVHTQQKSVDEAIQTRQSHFDYRSILSSLSMEKRAPHISISDLLALIDEQPLPNVRPVDMNQPYQVRIHPKLPTQQRFLIHEAILNARYRLATQLVNRSPEQLLLRDSWNRNPLHIAKTVGAESWVKSIEHHSTFADALQQRDGLGKTPVEIETWKKVHNKGPNPSASSLNGGWGPRRLEQHQGIRNEVDIVEYSQLSWKNFLQKYAACSKPVLIRGVPNTKEFQRRWQKERFLQKFSQMEF